MESPEKTKAILNQINNGLLEMPDELQIFEAIWIKYDFKGIAKYSKDNGITYKGVQYQIKKRLVQFIEPNGEILLFK